ncbi:hypothetical protein DJ93_4929 [Bacillus clarus]|uniref:Uncharacterized protein n=1 Tax=Bacillus clarus TaxID=2338372 RepID=A0A090ZFN7_9BACI|nr:hypothetical protein DJ93_4929 [Bacillus clarus]
MVWAILLLIFVFVVGALMKIPEISREEIHNNQQKMKIKWIHIKSQFSSNELHPNC